MMVVREIFVYRLSCLSFIMEFRIITILNELRG